MKARNEAVAGMQAAEGTVQMQQGELVAIRGELDAMRAQLATAEEAAVNARAEAEAATQLQAQLQAQLDAAAAQPEGPPAQDGAANLPAIPRPAGTGWSIREAMELDHGDYSEIQVSNVIGIHRRKHLLLSSL